LEVALYSEAGQTFEEEEEEEEEEEASAHEQTGNCVRFWHFLKFGQKVQTLFEQVEMEG
jgi:hypothetical protein